MRNHTTLLALALLVGCASAEVRRPADFGRTEAESWRYALVVDASSSASTLFVYQWRPGVAGGLPRIQAAPYPRQAGVETWEERVRPGLSAYAGRPQEAARSLEPLIAYARERIGGDAWSRTSLYLRATAGLRLLDPVKRNEILDAVSEYLATTPFASTSARVIEGTEEGIYGWLAVNYLLGHLEHGGPFPTVGALDLGGASAQITFVPLDFPREHGRAVRLGSNVYHLYSYSYLGLGQDVAREAVASPACFLRGYPLAGGGVGTGDFAACREAIRAKLGKPCPREPCSFLGVYQPPVYGDFLAFSVYAYTADFFGLAGRLSPAAMAEAGSDFCARSWQELMAEDPDAAKSPFVPLYCYAAAHAVTLLTDGFGFPESSDRIHAPARVQGAETGWPLGALLFELTGSTD